MLLRSFFKCRFHEIKESDGEQMSSCRRENCWSRYSKCVAMKALNSFLEHEVLESSPASTPR